MPRTRSDRREAPRIGFALAALSAVAALTGCPRTRAPLGPDQLAVDPAPGLFRDISSAAGVAFRHDPGLTGRFLFVETTPGGCAFLDYDRDGKLDVFLIQSGPAPGKPPPVSRPPCALYHNEGTHDAPRFRNVTSEAGLARDFGYLQGVASADFDNDGFPDLYLTGYGGCHLLRNDGKGRFTDVTESAGVGDTDQGSRWATSAAWGDYDRDGRLDLYVCHYCRWSPETEKPCVNRAGQRAYCAPTVYDPEVGRLYRNLGGGRFKDVTHSAGIDVRKGRGLGALWLDFDADGRPDLYVANDMNPNLLFRNRGNGTFEEVGLESGAGYGAAGEVLSGMGVTAADYDGDGFEDLYVTNFSGQTNSLFRSQGRGMFRHSTESAGMAGPTFHRLGFGVAFFDYDNDGWPDLVVGNGHVNPDIEQMGIGVGYKEPKGLYHNKGNGMFEDVSAHSGDMTRPQVTRGLAVGDFDNDGKLDILCNNLGGPAELFQNRSAGSAHYTVLRLAGRRSNRDGIGAVVQVVAGGKTRMAVCRASSSFLSSCDPRLHFGLGGSDRIDRIEIRWPSGLKETIRALYGKPLPVDSFLLATEGAGVTPDRR